MGFFFPFLIAISGWWKDMKECFFCKDPFVVVLRLSAVESRVLPQCQSLDQWLHRRRHCCKLIIPLFLTVLTGLPSAAAASRVCPAQPAGDVSSSPPTALPHTAEEQWNMLHDKNCRHTLNLRAEHQRASHPSARLHHSSDLLLSQQPAGHVLHHSEHLRIWHRTGLLSPWKPNQIT